MPKYIKKAIAEDKFIDYIIEKGIKTYYVAHECGNDYYCIDLINGERRFWTNISNENLEKLGWFKE